MSKTKIFLLTNIPVWAIFLAFIYSITFSRNYNASAAGGFTPDSFLLTLLYALNLTLWLFGSFYLSFLILVPKLLTKNKRNQFWGFSVVLSFLIIPLLILFLEVVRNGFRDGQNIYSPFKHFDSLMVFLFYLIPSMLIGGIISLISIGLGVLSRLAFDSFSNLEQKKVLENKQLLSELKLLKSKLNPHFLFNSLNNIDTLIQTNSDQASASLSKLSDLLRYVVYDTEREKVPIQQEIEHIQKYIELEKIRLTNPEAVVFTNKVSSKVLIPPMLFFPFIENGFKHSNLNLSGQFFTISIAEEGGKILFNCANTIDEKASDSNTGVGLELAQKRLALLYPNRHKLVIQTIDKSYQVNLEIELSEND